MKPSIEFKITFLILISSYIMFFLYGFIHMKNSYNECEQLNPKYGELFVVQEGFYKDKVFMSVQPDFPRVRGYIVKGNLEPQYDSHIRIPCGLLKRKQG